MKYIIKLPTNRVRRSYKGGAGIDWLHGIPNGIDGDLPEEWIASMVRASNPGMEKVTDEGYSICMIDGRRVLFKDLIREEPEFYLGEKHLKEKGTDLGFLFKILDSSMRLHVQAHPTAEFSNAYLNSRYGKLECYYILHVRTGVRPYIRLGFQRGPGREEWKRIIEEQDINAMDACFDPIPVEEGQIWFIPGGMPHAIGEGILMLEIMEPSDWVVRCEFDREGIVVAPEGRFMGRDLDFCLNIFDYNQYSKDEIRAISQVQEYLLEKGPGYRLEQLIDKKVTSCFEVKRLRLSKSGKKAMLEGGILQIGVVTDGEVVINCGGQKEWLVCGDSFMIAAAAEKSTIVSRSEKAEICFVTAAYES